ncbi:MAG: transglycosylase domain-containing protein, partial [Thermodesulfobacteriota bacterium]
HMPEKKGEYSKQKNSLLVYLRRLETPETQRQGFLARIDFTDKQIRAIQNVSADIPLALLELEPEEIMLFFGPERERRQLVSIQQVPEHVIHAVLAAEDTRFYSHHGADLRGILRALVVNLKHMAIRQGGSTITQQLAKNYFLTPERSFSRKFKELFMSLTMEQMYEKEEILEIYLNEIYLGQKGRSAVNGIGEAASFYFDKPVQALTVSEAAAIAGLIRGPNRFSPYVNPKRCKARRNHVLQTMYEEDWLDPLELHTAIAEPLEPAGYHAYGKKAPYFMDYLTRQLKALYSSEDLSSLGLSIYTTLDTEVQKTAERALEKGLSRLEAKRPELLHENPGKNLQGVVIVMQPQTGYILAMTGGRNYSVSQFNRAVKARRQPGSAFKPFIYTAALDRFTPASLLSNQPRTYEINGKPWTPKNYKEMPVDEVRMRTALARSINIATVNLAMQTGMDRILETSKAFGFSTIETAYPSIALGAMPVTPLELARAYCPFAANGILPYPLSLRLVADESGQKLQMRHTTVSRVISPQKAFLINSMLQSVVTEGTARSLTNRGITYPVAAKTGSTNNNRDAWFIGFTPDILALVWVGFDNGAPMKFSGARAALPIWADLMKQLPQHISGNQFTRPPGVVKKVICSDTGKLAVKNHCPQPVEEFFLKARAPEKPCPRHSPDHLLKQAFDDVKEIFK